MEHRCLDPSGPINPLAGLPKRKRQASSERGLHTLLLGREDGELAFAQSASHHSVTAVCSGWTHLSPVSAAARGVYYIVTERCLLFEHALYFFSIIKVHVRYGKIQERRKGEECIYLPL